MDAEQIVCGMLNIALEENWELTNVTFKAIQAIYEVDSVGL